MPSYATNAFQGTALSFSLAAIQGMCLTVQVLAALLHCGHKQTQQEVHEELSKWLDHPLEEWSHSLVGSLDKD